MNVRSPECCYRSDCSPTVPEAAMSSRSSLKDTLFLSRAESECVVEGRGRLWFGSVGRTGELGHKKIPGLRRTCCSSSVQRTHAHNNRRMERRETGKKTHKEQIQKLKSREMKRKAWILNTAW